MKRYGLIVTMAFLWIFGSAFSIWAAEFSADMVQTLQGKTYKGKVYIKGHLTRVEMNKDGQENIIITDLNKKTSYVLMPKEKTYMEMEMSGQMAAAGASEEYQQKIGKWKNLGTETVNGYVCEKRLFIYNDKSWGESTNWFAKKLNYPIKTIYKGKQGGEMTTEYKNIKEGGVSDSLFKIPAGYTKMNMPSMGGKGMIPGKGKIPTPPAGQDSVEDDD